MDGVIGGASVFGEDEQVTEPRQIEIRDDGVIVFGEMSQQEFNEAIEAFHRQDDFSWSNVQVVDLRSPNRYKVILTKVYYWVLRQIKMGLWVEK